MYTWAVFSTSNKFLQFENTTSSNGLILMWQALYYELRSSPCLAKIAHPCALTIIPSTIVTG